MDINDCCQKSEYKIERKMEWFWIELVPQIWKIMIMNSYVINELKFMIVKQIKLFYLWFNESFLLLKFTHLYFIDNSKKYLNMG